MPRLGQSVCLALVLALLVSPSALAAARPVPSATGSRANPPSGVSSPVANFTASVNRLVTLVGLSGGGLLAIVWARVALSWFSNDVAKKIQAKDRARDALIGTLLFTAALSGLIWSLAHWVITGS
ncbi:MAG TPA: hypothetical protein VEY07_08210 [Thermoplasmata archaeon]|nr:hypothetical protein [Thermoplasmata archaeon]